MKKFIFAFSISLLSLSQSALALPPPNPFGPNVYIFDPSMNIADINSQVLKIYATTNSPADGYRQADFSDNRYVFLFMPGKYGTVQTPIDVRVGTYTHVIGVGRTPNDTVLTGAVRTQDRPNLGGVTTVFWRSMENLAIIPTLGSLTTDATPKNQNVFAVSQAAPMRRIRIINGDLRLNDVSWSSGGFLADSRVDGTIFSGTQQQYILRNNQFANFNGSNWNYVFMGSTPDSRIPGGTWPNPPYTLVGKTPLVKEKPYLTWDAKTSQFVVNVRTRRRNVSGTDWHIAGTNIPLSAFYIVKAGDNAATMNAALSSGKHLFITPGVYHLNDTIKVTRRNTIIFGIGFPTFVSDVGKTIMEVDDVENVQLAGFMIDGGPVSSETLLQVGPSVNTRTHTDPVYISDVFCRVGGPMNYKSTAKTCMIFNSNDVVLDDTWLWRADHGYNVGWDINKGDTGIIINGARVITYNLMSEHFQKWQVVWNGEDGQMYEFQTEPPYDVPNQGAWMDGNRNGYSVFKIANVKNFLGRAFGTYTNFNNQNIWIDSAILAPEPANNVKLDHMIGFWLNGGGGFRHMVNNQGCGVQQGPRFCTYPKWPE